MNKSKLFIPYIYLIIIYFLIFLQFPISLASGRLLFHADITTNIEPTYLLVWGLTRILIVLPLIYELITFLDKKPDSIFLNIGNRKRVIAMTFWMTLIFTILGTFLYPYFLVESKLTIGRLMYLIPIFSLYAISNAFVEETFFRGASLSILTEKIGFFAANLFQAFFFALIHIINPMSSNLMYFILLTFILGLAWGIITKYTKSLIPAVVCHVIADIFVAISLF